MLCLKHLKLAGPWYHYEMRRIGDKAKKGTQKNGAIVNIISEKLGNLEIPSRLDKKEAMGKN